AYSGVSGGQMELSRPIGLENSQVRDHSSSSFAACRRQKVEPRDEYLQGMTRNHDSLPNVCCDLRRASGSGQSDFGRSVVTDNCRVQVSEAVDLCSTKESQVNAPALQPITKHLRHADEK